PAFGLPSPGTAWFAVAYSEQAWQLATALAISSSVLSRAIAGSSFWIREPPTSRPAGTWSSGTGGGAAFRSPPVTGVSSGLLAPARASDFISELAVEVAAGRTGPGGPTGPARSAADGRGFPAAV